ncbi:MAG: hypothetical protein LBM98_03765 [Oscillospiraceae bacterium]|nr:hypothetical protein [Oscillospiraceae bacterium]
MRYAGRIGARQSSAASVTYICFPPGTGLLRTCNIVCIAGLPVLRNDGAPSRRTQGRGEALPCPGAMRRDGGRELRNPGEASLAPTSPAQPTSKSPVIVNYQLSIVNCQLT